MWIPCHQSGSPSTNYIYNEKHHCAIFLEKSYQHELLTFSLVDILITIKTENDPLPNEQFRLPYLVR